MSARNDADVERVARALYACNPAQDQAVDPDDRAIGKPFDLTYEQLVEGSPKQHAWLLEQARAAIAAWNTLAPRTAGRSESAIVAAIAKMMSKHVTNWPEHKRVRTSIALVDKTMTALLKTAREQEPCGATGEQSANAAAEGLAKALEAAAAWFDDYATEHYRKAKNAPSAGEQHGSEVKGKTNADRAAELRTALAAYRAGQPS